MSRVASWWPPSSTWRTTSGLRTVAEGIERPTQLARLKDMHCDLGQGFHVGKPMPADQVVDLLALERSRQLEAGLPAPRPTADSGWAS